MRAREFVTEAKTVDYEGLTLKVSKNNHELMVDALDDWGNNVLGHVTFYIGDDRELDPQDLRVDDRYQGQGIAKTMYDYVKSLGYKIVRSWDQTDAGAGFWNKHRGQDVRVWEAFDNPYKTKTEKSEYGDVDMLAKLPDGTNLSIMFNHEGNNEWQVEFYRDNSQEVTGQGDAQRIFATVLAAIQKFVKQYQPDVIKFSAEKSNNSDSRSSLYDRLVARFAQQLGYNDYSEEYMSSTMYELSKQSQGIAEDWKDAAATAAMFIPPLAPYAKAYNIGKNLYQVGKAVSDYKKASDELNAMEPEFAAQRERQTAQNSKFYSLNDVDKPVQSNHDDPNIEKIDELSFLGSECTKDCSGHRAGYDWSKRKGLRQANSWSPSFNKGAGLAVAGK